MTRVGRVGAFGLTLAAFLVTTFLRPIARAEDASDLCERCPVATGSEQGAIEVTHGVSETVPNRGSGKPASYSGHKPYSYTNEYATPTCSGNALNGVDNVCSAAVNTCPSPTQVRFWIWHQVVDVIFGPPPNYAVLEAPHAWQQEAGSYCLGPDDPAVPTIAKVIAAVQDMFASQTLPLPKWVVRTDPGPRTLVHFPTSFSAGSQAAQQIDTTILGTAVHITAVPQQWTWFFGDGQTLVTTTPGRPKSEDITHNYGDLGAVPTHVVVQWGGTFRVGGAPQQYAIRNPATVTGPTTIINVLQSRAQLVSH